MNQKKIKKLIKRQNLNILLFHLNSLLEYLLSRQNNKNNNKKLII
jgi:hypothetical protein